MAMKRKNRREHGQVIYLLAVGIITLLGFTALAVDGARLLGERRTIQGVADTAAFTAASYLGQYTTSYIEGHWNPYSSTSVDQLAESAALERVHSNGYTGSAYNPWGGNDWLRVTISKSSTTLSKEYEVHIWMISEIDPIFAQVIYDGPLRVYVESTAIVRPRTNLGFGQAMYSLSEDAEPGIAIGGTADVNIQGSGIYANSSGDPAINYSGNAGIAISDDVTTPGSIDIDGTPTITTGGDDTGVDPQAFPYVPTPDCSGLPTGYAVDDGAGTTIFHPGIWYGNIQITSAASHQVFLPGLYCLKKDFKITNANLTAHDVTFYLNTGSFTVNGGTIDMVAPRHGEADDGTNSWDGMLFYVGDGDWTVSGNSGTYMEGTVYAPGSNHGECALEGSGMTDAYNLQLVCDTIKLEGGAGLNIDFNNDNAYEPPVSIDLIQ
jgi:hypothetical protein